MNARRVGAGASRFLVPALALLGLLLGAAAHALSYVPFADDKLRADAALIVDGEVVARRAAPAGGATLYRLRVDETLAGERTATVEVAVPGGALPGGRWLHVEGAPALAVGDHVLLFLARTAQGELEIADFPFGAFRVRAGGVGRVAEQTLPSDPRLLDGARVRDYGRFAAWARLGSELRTGNSASAGDDYLVSARGLVAAPFSVHTHFGVPVRWQTSSPIEVVQDLALPSGAGWPRSQLVRDAQSAFAAARPGFPGIAPDVVWRESLVAAFDGDNEIQYQTTTGPLYVCGQGGVLATTYSYYADRRFHDPRGGDFHPIVETDVVFSRGVDCRFSRPAGDLTGTRDFLEVLAHELGHFFGLGHATDPQALMYPVAHMDGLGPRPTADDVAGIDALYELAPGSAHLGCPGSGPLGVRCFRRGRFRIAVDFRLAGHDWQPAQLQRGSDEGGMASFFSPSNPEVFVKVLDGCGYNDRFWVFVAGLTDVETRVVVDDLDGEQSRTYRSPAGTAFAPIQDTAAFATCP